jgi:arginase
MNSHELIEVAVDEEDIHEVENNILGYHKILQQLKNANIIVSSEQPDSIFTVGGGCDVELIPVSYLNKHLNGDLTVLWLDAHGDLNTPESSPSKHFHGMPLRTLLGDGDPQLLEAVHSKLLPNQLLLIGQRDLDQPEQEYIDENNIDLISIEKLNMGMDDIIQAVKSKGSENIYIHIDLDILDFEAFPYVMVPSPGGLKPDLLSELLLQLKNNFNVAGLSLLEYTSSDDEALKILSDVIKLGAALSHSH